MPALSLGKTTVAYSGSTVDYTIATTGIVQIKLWGGGGGGTNYSGTAQSQHYGYGGGFTKCSIHVTAGDTVTVQVGQGGQSPIRTPTVSGGVGGYPDGGSGGANNATLAVGGGGGGSSRVYLNGSLVAVAGAGGGGGGTPGTALNAVGGSGGGGLTSLAINANITGASQSAGGVNSFGDAAGQSGSMLQGGNGYNTGFSTAFTTSTLNAAGGGGGGGYYGGAGGGHYIYNSVNSGAASGTGGSGWTAASTYDGATYGSAVQNNGTPAHTYDVDYPAGVALYGAPVSGTASRASNGGNGAIVLNYVATIGNLPQGKTAIAATGNIVSYNITQTGVLRVKMWGGAGGGATIAGNAPNARGSAGGYTSFDLSVVSGDVVAFQTAVGGGPAIVTAGHVGGTGGWPDGGPGGYDSSSFYNGGGGGGGSSRVFLNGNIIGVAGGGGGGAGNGSGVFTGSPGNGGGTAGGSNTQTATVGGGTQSAGGVNTNSQAGLQTGEHFQGSGGFPFGNGPAAAAYFYGGGGGGGYYGGAGGGAGYLNGSAGAAGGGGSGYVNPSGLVANGATASPGTTGSQTPLNNTDLDYLAASNISVGGNGIVSTSANGTAGGNGLIVVDFILALPVGDTSVEYTGIPVSWQAPTAGTVTLKLWGGGGGSHNTYDAGQWGGAGGKTSVTIAVTAGDVLQVYTGQGGQVPSATTGGVGGWPDGGYGMRRADGNTSYGGGGGGGSSRVYKNGTLVAVGSGGGGAFLSTSGQAPGGAGGGVTGATGTFGGTGGSVSSGGGVSPTSNAATNGNLLKGGVGALVAVTATTSAGGGGGGGGYYGGGSGYSSGAYTGGGGGGGAGFIDVSYSGSTVAASNAVPPSDAVLPTGRAVGGIPVSGGTPPARAGGNGFVFMTFTQTSLPVTATGPIGTILVVLDLIGLVVSQAVVNIPPADNDIILVPSDNPKLTASVQYDVPIHGGDNAIHLILPSAYIPGHTAGDLGTDIVLSWVTPNGPVAETGPEYSPTATPDIVLSLVGTVTPPTGAGNAFQWNPLDEHGNPVPHQAFVQITLFNPDGSPSSGAPTVTPEDLPNDIIVTPPVIFAESGKSVVLNDLLQITLSLGTTASSTGAGAAYGAPENIGDPNPLNWYMKLIRIILPVASLNAGANFDQSGDTGDMTIIMVRPNPTTSSGATILSSVSPARIVLLPADAGAAENNGAMGVGSLADLVITLSEPSYTVQTSPNVPDAILMEVVDGYVDMPPAPGFAKIKLKRSISSKTTPLLLQHNEVALNESDGILFSRDADGFIRPTPYLGFGEGRVVPLGGENGQVLSVFLDWRAPHFQTTNPLIEPMPTNTQLYLGADLVSEGNVALRPTPVHNYVIYKPFFVQRPVVVTALLANQATPNLDADAEAAPMSVWLGLAEWNRDFARPGEIYSVRKFDLADGGSADNPLSYALTQELVPGWYTSVFAYEGALDGVEFTAGQCGPFLRGDMIVQGNPYGLFDGGLFPSQLPGTNHNYLPATHLMDHVDLAFVQAVVGNP